MGKWWFNRTPWDLPPGNLLHYLWNMVIEIVDVPLKKNVLSIVLFVYQRVHDS